MSTEKQKPPPADKAASKRQKGKVRAAPPYSSSGGRAGGVDKRLSREEFEERTLPLIFRCGITHERTQKIKEAVCRVRVGDKTWATFVIRAKPDVLATFNMRTIDAKIDLVVFPVSAVQARERLTPYQHRAMLTQLPTLVDFEAHSWKPGKNPIKKTAEDDVEDFEDPVLKDLLSVSPEAERLAKEINKKVQAGPVTDKSVEEKT